MSSVTTSVRIDDVLKKEASLLAKKLWLNLGTVISIYLKKFVSDRAISISEDEVEWRTVLDLGDEGVSPAKLLAAYEQEHGQTAA